MHLRNLIVLFATLISAAEASAQGIILTDVFRGNNTYGAERLERRFQLSAGRSQYAYEEPGLMKISGPMNEIRGVYKHPLMPQNTPMFIGADVRYAESTQMNYDGALQGKDKNGKIVTTPYSTTSRDRLTDIQATFGASIMESPIQALEVYGGLGRWQLVNRINGEYGYDRRATYVYLPIGMNYAHRLGPVVLKAGAEYNSWLTGQTVSGINDGTGKAIVHEQPSGNGMRINAGGEFSLGQVALMVNVYHQRWDVEASNIVMVSSTDGYVEPKNNTRITGITVGATF